MLNFLIAVVSQSYEVVMSQSKDKEYNDKAQLNKEAYLFMDAVDFLVA